MRDLVLTAVIFGLIPVILARSWTGILVWSWLGYMNPHRLTWGFAYSMPFAQIIALVIFVSLFFSKEKKKLIWSREITVLALFIVWCIITTQFALNPDYASLQLEKVLKIQLMTFMTLVLIDRKERIEPLIWVIVFSLGFYGVKGGIFTITSGGGFHVMGPLGTFIGGNNEIGLAMLMTLPLMRYIQLQTKQRWVKLLMAACLGLTFIAILGTQSRGALVGAIVTGAFLIWNSPRKFTFLLLIALAVPPSLQFMPDSWWDRMDTIQTYEEDASAQGRISAWTFAVNVARARVTGGGFECFQGRIFRQYHNGPVHDAHSIWFEILGEHGFIGLGLFFSLGFLSWLTCRRTIKMTKGIEDLQWANNLSRMLQVVLVAYASAGSFLGLAYFDLFYCIVVLAVITNRVAAQTIEAAATRAKEDASEEGASLPALAAR